MRTKVGCETIPGYLWSKEWKRHCFWTATRVVGSRFFLVSLVLLVSCTYGSVSINVAVSLLFFSFFFFGFLGIWNFNGILKYKIDRYLLIAI